MTREQAERLIEKLFNAREAMDYAQARAEIAHRLTFGGLPDRIHRWVQKTFGLKLLIDRKERAMRCLEEAMELAQAEGVRPGEATALLLHVYNRPVGEPSQEGAGLQVCLHAWAMAASVDLEEVTAAEVLRIESLPRMTLRTKQLLKADRGLALAPE